MRKNYGIAPPNARREGAPPEPYRRTQRRPTTVLLDAGAREDRAAQRKPAVPGTGLSARLAPYGARVLRIAGPALLAVAVLMGVVRAVEMTCSA